MFSICIGTLIAKYVVIVVVTVEVWAVANTKIAGPSWSTMIRHRPPNNHQEGTNIIATFVIYAAEMRKATVMNDNGARPV
jgi:hypothetical protein